ncbi:MAG: hypothetical protein Q8P07_04585 [bacterium]|nr:hypothetical protein [bacterium]
MLKDYAELEKSINLHEKNIKKALDEIFNSLQLQWRIFVFFCKCGIYTVFGIFLGLFLLSFTGLLALPMFIWEYGSDTAKSFLLIIFIVLWIVSFVFRLIMMGKNN